MQSTGSLMALEDARTRTVTSHHVPAVASLHATDADASLTQWRQAVLYQVYVKSFADANNDGVGDIAGLVSRLAYVKEIGVDALWLSPWYVSPMRDGGYDVQDYLDIDPLFGTLEHAQTLIDACHERGLRVVLDFVANHCSDQHPWFQSALAAPEGAQERRRFYFKNGRGEHGDEPPNDWKSFFGGSAWTRIDNSDGTPGQWYLHLFDASQPDLNWKNDDVLHEFDNILRFWFDRGVDGFRLDAVPAIGKDDDFRDLGLLLPSDAYDHDTWGPAPFFDADGVHAVLRRWRRIAREYADEKFLVGEVPLRDVARLSRYLRHDELHSSLSLELATIEWSADSFRHAVDRLRDANLHGHSWPTWTLSSHDEKRTTSRYSPDETTLDGSLDATTTGKRRARAAYLLALALPGSACIYQGEELGLGEVTDIPDEKRQDPIYFRTNKQSRGRDGCRVPMPWEPEGPTLGFNSDHEPWLPQPRAWSEISVATQLMDGDSTLRFFRTVLQLRSTIFSDDERDVTWEDAPRGVLIFRRGPNFRCVVNFSGQPWRVGDNDVMLVTSAPLRQPGVIDENVGAWLREASHSTFTGELDVETPEHHRPSKIKREHE
ncbi:MAG: alpha-amylase family glycosyl hydrolase [Acidimicrobiales bacterium]